MNDSMAMASLPCATTSGWYKAAVMSLVGLTVAATWQLGRLLFWLLRRFQKHHGPAGSSGSDWDGESGGINLALIASCIHQGDQPSSPYIVHSENIMDGEAQAVGDASPLSGCLV